MRTDSEEPLMEGEPLHDAGEGMSWGNARGGPGRKRVADQDNKSPRVGGEGPLKS